MSGVSIQISGLNEIIAKLDTVKFEKNITGELKRFGADVAKKAKDFAPVDEGYLKGQIGSESTQPLTVDIFAKAVYSAYLEFGTRKFAAQYVPTLPQDWQTLAGEAKGKGGGTMDEFIQNIMAWVQRKGIGSHLTASGNRSNSNASLESMQQAAYWIAINILQNGIKPHPYMYPAFEAERQNLLDRLKNLLNA